MQLLIYTIKYHFVDSLYTSMPLRQAMWLKYKMSVLQNNIETINLHNSHRLNLFLSKLIDKNIHLFIYPQISVWKKYIFNVCCFNLLRGYKL